MRSAGKMRQVLLSYIIYNSSCFTKLSRHPKCILLSPFTFKPFDAKRKKKKKKKREKSSNQTNQSNSNNNNNNKKKKKKCNQKNAHSKKKKKKKKSTKKLLEQYKKGGRDFWQNVKTTRELQKKSVRFFSCPY